ncbi:NUDIX domain-containing protein [Streptomyces sp. NPDC059491]|uniref:NUDIX domain-containing protein n=1 Tax=Streptomyces sp. NPDC059491 TaxID=3346850 RepID=UPI0036D0AB21
MTLLNLRHSVRAIVLDEEDRILLCRLALPERCVWATPSGGIEPGETPYEALGRELREEIGLALQKPPPHVWHRRVVAPGYVEGYDGAVQDYFLVRTQAFDPGGTLSPAELLAENITGFRWWRLPEIADHPGPDLFGPRDLAGPLGKLIKEGVPLRPLEMGL